jgi:hypothetical protein
MQGQKRINIGFADVADERLFAAATSELFRDNELLAGSATTPARNSNRRRRSCSTARAR